MGRNGILSTRLSLTIRAAALAMPPYHWRIVTRKARV
jgi:hypothetical protein